MKRKLRKIPGKKWISGVCAGVAYWVGAPDWVVRAVWFASIFLNGFGLFLYLILWIFMPKWPYTPLDYTEITNP